MQVYTQTNVMTIHFSRLHSINHEKLHNQHVSIHFVTCDCVYSHLTHIDISKIYIQYLIISALNKLNWQRQSKRMCFFQIVFTYLLHLHHNSNNTNTYISNKYTCTNR